MANLSSRRTATALPACTRIPSRHLVVLLLLWWRSPTVALSASHSATAGLRASVRAAHRSQSRVSPFEFQTLRAQSLRRQASLVHDLGMGDREASVLRHQSDVLSSSPFDVVNHCQSRGCPAFDTQVLDSLQPSVNFCFCFVPDDVTCYVGQCAFDLFAHAERTPNVAADGACAFHRRIEDIVDRDECSSIEAQQQQYSEAAVTSAMAKDPKAKMALARGTPMPSPPPLLPADPTRPMSVQDTVDLLAAKARRDLMWNLQNSVIAAAQVKKEVEKEGKKASGPAV
jgi:hypothetical protein